MAKVPGNARAHYSLGIVLARRGQLDDAMANCQMALELNPNSAEAHYNLGLVLATCRRTDEAIAQYEKALELDPDYAEAHNNLGCALVSCKRVDEAVVHWETAVKLKPDSANAHYNLGNAMAGRGQIDEAITYYQKALEIQPHYAEAHNNLGNVLVSLGRFDEAIVHYQKALEVKPDYTNARNNLGIVQSRREGILKDLAQRRESLRSRPNDVALLNETAWILATNPNASIRNGTEAVELTERAARLSDGREVAIIGTLAAAYAEAGRFSEAVQTARKAAELATRQNNRPLAESINVKISLYEAGTPFREVPQPPAAGSTQP